MCVPLSCMYMFMYMCMCGNPAQTYKHKCLRERKQLRHLSVLCMYTLLSMQFLIGLYTIAVSCLAGSTACLPAAWSLH